MAHLTGIFKQSVSVIIPWTRSIIGWWDKLDGIESNDHCNSDKNRRPQAMIYELRVYHAMPGKMPDLLNRFELDDLRHLLLLDGRQLGEASER